MQVSAHQPHHGREAQGAAGPLVGKGCHRTLHFPLEFSPPSGSQEEWEDPVGFGLPPLERSHSEECLSASQHRGQPIQDGGQQDLLRDRRHRRLPRGCCQEGGQREDRLLHALGALPIQTYAVRAVQRPGDLLQACAEGVGRNSPQCRSPLPRRHLHPLTGLPRTSKGPT